ncbi:MAG: hypothetical protein ACJATI_000167 [Halioglobus sp.]|jgi:hypothetical protein
MGVEPFNEQITTKCGTDHSVYPSGGDGNSGNDGTVGSGGSSVLPATTIDVLVLYTESGSIADLQSPLSHAMSQLNMIDDNSDIPDINFNLVGIDRIDYLENPTHNFNTIFGHMIANAEVRDLRDAYGADIVLIGLDYISEEDTWGRAGTIDINAESSIAVMQISKMSRDHTLVHEAFHMFDCGHESGASQPDEIYQHAKYMNYWNKEHGTVMWSSEVDDETILYLSNPDVDYDPGWLNDEQPTGHVVNRDNSRRANEVASTVSDFRPSTFNNHVVTVGGGWDYDDATYNFITMCKNELNSMYWMNSGDMEQPYTSVWEISNDGISYTPISLINTIPFGIKIDPLGWGTIKIRTNANPVPGNYTIRLKVTKDGVENVDYMLLNILACPGFTGGDNNETESRNLFKNDQNIKIYPTVLQDGYESIKIKSQLTNLDFILNDVSGQFITGGKVIANEISLENLMSGIYFISIISENKRILTKRIVKQ